MTQTRLGSLIEPVPVVAYRPDLSEKRFNGGQVSEQCPKCARHCPECASPGACHYDAERELLAYAATWEQRTAAGGAASC